jgi:Xaa-Pro aminopeptidase/Xaa-Pro dipeptidase
MFAPAIHQARRAALTARFDGGLLLFVGNDEASINFHHNTYPFVQDGSFRYFFGLATPGLAGLIDVEAGQAWIFGDDANLDQVIWLGPQTALKDRAAGVGVEHVAPSAALATRLGAAIAQGRQVRYLPPYRADTTLKLADLLGVPHTQVAGGVSPDLIAAVVALREIKGPEEIAEMERALAVTRQMHHTAMRNTRPGRFEHDVTGEMESLARGADLQLAYQSVFSVRGEVLHNFRHDRRMEAGDLVVNDSGAVSALGYASDITRTFPVSGTFTPLQRRLYEVVLDAQLTAIGALRPGVRFADAHRLAARRLVEGLTELGLFRGDPDHIVESGAYALCFQCGLGHQIGLDVHDLEALGEDHVGYDAQTPRSALFGLRSLRLGKTLKAGMTVTIEPGLYFIPQLIDLWRAEGRFAELIDYDRFDAFRAFGGIRIEDDVLITPAGAVVLGPPIAKTVDEIEALMASGPVAGSEA